MRSLPAGLEARPWRDIVRRLSEPYQIEGQEVLLSASIGIAHYPDNGSSVDQLLTNADTALYRAKESGRAAFRLYEPAMDVRIAEQRLLERDLLNAVALEQLSIFYQPVLDSENCEITGFEALLRWFHPMRGEISPDEFIPIAEESGLMGRLAFWVMETACAEAVKWPEPSRIAINLSPKLFMEPDLPDRVAVILARTGLPPDRLVLEVTEGVLIDNRQSALAAMSSLKNQGILIALDDFGTGYASFGYLRRFPFDSIKIDRSFIGTLCEDEESCAIVPSSLMHSLRLKVIAEVPIRHNYWLRAEVAASQGFLFAKAMPARQIGHFLANKARRSADAPVPDVAD